MILEEKIENNKKWIIRKHEQEISFLYNDEDSIIYNETGPNKKPLFETRTYPVVYNIFEIWTEENMENGKKICWFKIKDSENRIGWICAPNFDPYNNGNGIILELLTIRNKDWIVIKIADGGVYNIAKLNVRDKPGLVDSKILFQLEYNDSGPENHLETLAITNEKDTIDNITDRWVKIKDEAGRIGWVFGGYVSEQKGSKYDTPENIISFYFNHP
jgi:hypothetical protein